MTPPAARHAWDAAGYDESFSFVTTHGAPLLDLLAAKPGERILDIGCGTGHQAAALAASGVHVVGLDSDAAMVERAREAHPELEFVQADAQSIDEVRATVGRRGFDGVLSNAALHWMPEQDAVVAAIGAVVVPGGRVVLEMGGIGNVARVTSAIRAARQDCGLDPELPSPWTFPSPGEQAARFERHGFLVRLVQLFDRVTPLDADSTASAWARMFGAALVADVPDERRAEFDTAVDVHASALGLDRLPDGAPGWWIDYVRLRLVAVRV